MPKYDAVRRAVVAERSAALSAGIAILAVLIPTVLRGLLGQTGAAMPFVTYYPAILLAAIFTGWRWAGLATLLSAFVANHLFLPRSLLDHPTAPHMVLVGFFALSCTIIVLTGDALRRTMREMEQAAHEREIYGREMFHRVQNVLAVVQALARTGDPDQSIAAYREALSGRIAALSAANQYLWDPARHQHPVRHLVELALEPFNSPRRFTLAGPDCMLPPEHGHQLVLVLHELAANALRHGALTVPGGMVAIEWQAGPPAFRLEWRETGGPPVRPPSRKGLGTRLLASQRKFAIDFDFAVTGVVCTVVALQAPGDGQLRASG
ncbi:MAG: DUF4118 domain-containing protein [Sphingomonadales bacterium]|nr:DUF4118 domain-containing protein [Sphingomonadales bacterium]